MYESGGELNKYQESPGEVNESSEMPDWYPKYREGLLKLEAEKNAVYESYGAMGRTVPQSVKEQLDAKYKSFMIDSGMEHGEATPTWMDYMLAKAEPGYIDAAGLSGYPAGLRRIDVKRLGFHQNDPKGIADFLEEVRNEDRPPMPTKGPNKVIRSFKPVPTNPIEEIEIIPDLYGAAYGGELDQYRRRGSVFGTKAIQAVPWNRALTGRTGTGGVSDMYTQDAEGNRQYLSPQEIQAMTQGARLVKAEEIDRKNAILGRNRRRKDGTTAPRREKSRVMTYEYADKPAATTEDKKEVTVANDPAYMNKQNEVLERDGEKSVEWYAEYQKLIDSGLSPDDARKQADAKFANTKYFTSKSNDYIPGDIDPAYQASTDVYENLVLNDPWLLQKDYSNPLGVPTMEEVYDFNPEAYGLTAVTGGNLVDEDGNIVVERETGFTGPGGYSTTPLDYSQLPNQQRGGGLDSFVYGGDNEVGYMSDFDIEQFRRAGGEIEFI